MSTTQKPIYFDFAAATPIAPVVLSAMEPYFAELFYNPSAIYLSSKSVRSALEEARSCVARLVGARSGEIVFTAGATEANNLAIQGIVSADPNSKVVLSSIEHDSVMHAVPEDRRIVIPVDTKGRVVLDELSSSLKDPAVVLVSIMYANNEIGTVQDLRAVRECIDNANQDREVKVLLHTDAAQAPNYLDIHATRLGVDLMTLSAAKIYGPKQVGCLYVRAGIRLKPLINGGGQEFGIRSGTENVAGVIGFAKALEGALDKRHSESDRLKAIRERAVDEIAAIPGISLNGHQKHILPNNINLCLPSLDGETAVMMLDEWGVQAATGSACGASKDGPSHVLTALGLSVDEAERSLRITFGRSTTQDQVDYLITLLRKLANHG